MEIDVSESKEDRFHQLQEDAKNLASIGKIAESIKLFQEAYAINPTKKVQKRIGKLQMLLEEYGEEIDESMVEVDDKFYLYHELYKKLYPYQKEGVKWLWNLFQKKKGGVLGDDMGLGKTIQIIAFLSGMFDMDAIKYVLVIMPVSLLPNWEKEFIKWTPGLSTYCFHGNSKREREKMLMKTQNRGGVLLTSYGMLVNNVDLLSAKGGREFVWDYVILDEAHKIKNPTKATKAVHCIPAKNRIALTGTPIQNNLKELWSLYDFVQQGTLLGSLKTFKMQYETPITRSREKDATAGERRLGTEIAESLIKLIQPYFLRRTKQEVLSQKEENNNATFIDEGKLRKVFHISRKNDFIIWLYLSEKQIEIYNDFLKLDRVKNILMTKRSPLVELTILKKICDHPRLLSKRACRQLGLDGDIPSDTEDEIDDDTATAVSIENVTDEDLIKESGKLRFVLSLLSNLRETGHRTLLFSQSRKMLDIIHRILISRNWKVMRIDGTINKIEERQKRIQVFQQDQSIPIFLLTTQVGGVGFTLTGADRVVIYDPSWNPATDAQAVDRVYRIGQDKNVIIYRLITCSSVEEKIYRRQIFKDSITRQATGGNKDPYRYFTKQELRELFCLEDPYHSATQVQLEKIHSSQRNSDATLDGHIAFLYSLNIFGISDHDLMFTGEQKDDDVLHDEVGKSMNDDYIKRRVETAQQLLSIESAMTSEDNAKSNIYVRPYALPAKPVKNNTTKDWYQPPIFPNPVDLNEINRSLQHMSFQESVDISASSIISDKKPEDNVADSELDFPVKFEQIKSDLVEPEENPDKVIYITDEDYSEGNQNPSSVVAMDMSVYKRSRRSLLYVPESDNETAENSETSGEMFVPDSEESIGSDTSNSPSYNENEYRNIETNHNISQGIMKKEKPDNSSAKFSVVHHNTEVPITNLSTDHIDASDIELPDLCSLPNECRTKAVQSNTLPQALPPTEQFSAFAHENSSQIIGQDYCKKEGQHFPPAPFTSTRNKCSPILRKEIKPNDTCLPETKSLRSNDTVMPKPESDICHYNKVVPMLCCTVDCIEQTDDCKEEKHFFLAHSTPVKEISPMVAKRITPLKIPNHQTYSPGNSSFQKALLHSMELDPAKASITCAIKTNNHNLLQTNTSGSLSLNTIKDQKLQHDSLMSETSLRMPGASKAMPINSWKSETFCQELSMSDISCVSVKSNHSVVSTERGSETIEKHDQISFTRNLSYEFEQSTKYNESDCSPVKVTRKPCRQILDSSDESD